MRPLSYSSISRYLRCPLLFKFVNIDGLKERPAPYFSFGNSLHLALEFFYGVKVPPPPSLEEVLRHYEENWIKEGYDSEEDEKRHLEFGRKILTEFYESHIKDFKVPLCVEKEYILDLNGTKLKAKIDRIDKLDRMAVEIIDYKSNKDPITLDQLKDSLQLAIYQIVVERKLGVKVEKLTYYQLRSQIPISTERYQDERIAQVGEIILNTAGDIEKGNFEARLNDYCPCDFPHLCPYYKDRYSPHRIEELEGMERRVEIREVVEEYVARDKEKKEIDARLEELKEIINRYCDEKGVERVFGIDYYITRRLIEHTGFEEEDVKDILIKAGYWEEVRRFKSSLVRRLLEDSLLDKFLRRELESKKKVLRQYPRFYHREIEELEE